MVPRRHATPLAFLALANAVSLTGNVIATVAIPWLVLTTTGSAALTGIALFAGAGAAAVGGLIAGRVVDAVGPTRTSAVADVLSAVAVLPLPLLLAADALELWHVVVLAIAGTIADSAGSTARQSLVPAAASASGVPNERANALFTSAEHVGYLLGAPLAGVLIAVIGTAGALALIVAMFASAAVVVALLVRVEHRRVADEAAGRVGLAQAARVIWSDPALRALVIFPTAATLLIGPLVPIVLPVMAREAYGNPLALGILVAGFGAGGLIGAASFGVFGRGIPRRALFASVNVAWPAIYATLSLVPTLIVAVAMVLTLGIAAGSLVPMMATVRQERSPVHLLPRVVGLSTALVPVAGPISVLAVGFLLESLGIRATMVVLTAGTVALGVATLTSDGVRTFDATRPAALPANAGGAVAAATS